MSLKKTIHLFVLLIAFSFSSNANTPILQLAKQCAGMAEKECMDSLFQKIELLEPDSAFIVLEKTGIIFSKKGKFESAHLFFDKMKAYQADDDYEKSRNVAALKGKAFLYSGDLEKAHQFFKEQLLWSEKIGDKSKIALAKTNLGNINRKKGERDLAIKYFHESIALLEENKDTARLGSPYYQLGILYGMHDNEKKSIDAFRQAIYYYRAADIKDYVAASQVNLGNTFISIGLLDSAIYYLNTALPFFEENEELRDLVNAKTQLGRAYGMKGDHEAAVNVVLEATSMAEQLNVTPQVAYNYRLLSTLYRSLNQPQLAVNAAKKSVAEHRKIGINDGYDRSLKELSEAYGAAGDYKNAYVFSQKSRVLSDSLFTELKEYEIGKAEEKFEKAKKAQEIAVVEAERELEKVKRSRLQLLIMLISLLAFSGISLFYLKNKKDKILLEKQRDIEIGKRENIELEKQLLQKDLNQKRRELTSNALLISKKNEFLKSLLKRIESGAHEPQKLKRLVKTELQSDQDWDDFIAAFRNSHQAFFNKLFEIEKSLSKSELKLACLLKMNFQTKEIASLLNISYEGVKKAKYRLKQKLQIGTAMDLHSFILSID